jgi:hypothetical protein
MTCAHIAAAKGSVAVVKELMRFNKGVVTTARNRVNHRIVTHYLTVAIGYILQKETRTIKTIYFKRPLI